MINTEHDKMRKCAECMAHGWRSTVYPYRMTGDFNYEKDGTELHFQQHDVYWDEEGIPHSHVSYNCNKGHIWRGECESCAWGKEQVALVPPTIPVPTLAPPVPVMLTPPVPVLPPPPVRDTSNDLVLAPPVVKR